MESFAAWLVDVIHGFGWPGIGIAAFLGNALIPIPLEVIMIPAGYLIQSGEMNVFAVMLSAIVGDIGGSLFGYWLAYHFGRKFIFSYGKYIFLKHEKMEALDRFFASHGEISVLTGRLVPGLRHFMAFPAGMSHMNIKKFTVYTGVGGGLWSATLILVGYLIGGNKDLVKHYMPLVTGTVTVGVIIMIVIYTWRHRMKKSKTVETTHDAA